MTTALPTFWAVTVPPVQRTMELLAAQRYTSNGALSVWHLPFSRISTVSSISSVSGTSFGIGRPLFFPSGITQSPGRLQPI